MDMYYMSVPEELEDDLTNDMYLLTVDQTGNDKH